MVVVAENTAATVPARAPAQPKVQLPMKRRVLYIGSAVPMETTRGLDAIQQPLRERYPTEDDSNIQGVDAILSVFPTGLQMKYVGDPDMVIWFPVSSITICAAVRCVHIVDGSSGTSTTQFVSLSSLTAGGANSNKPAIFTAITRRTSGRKVLECHGFVCASSKDALELVQATKFADANANKQTGNGPLGSTRNSSVVQGNEENLLEFTPQQLPIKIMPASSVETNEGTLEIGDMPPTKGYFYSAGTNLVKKYTISRKASPEGSITPSVAQSMPANRPIERTAFSERARMFSQRQFVPRMSLAPRPRAMMALPPQLMRAPPPRGARGMLTNGPYRQLRVPMPQMVRDPHVFAPPPPIFVNTPYAIRHQPGMARYLSTQTTPRMNGQARSKSRTRNGITSDDSEIDVKALVHPSRIYRGAGINYDGDSSDSSSSPSTPVADYPRFSRRDQFEQEMAKQRHRPKPNTSNQNHMIYRHVTQPPEPGYRGYPIRTNSVPPDVMRTTVSESELARKRKGKKSKSSTPRQSVEADISSDGYPGGYVSEGNPQVARPRDWRRSENQFKNERAFSLSIMEETRRSQRAYEPVASNGMVPVQDETFNSSVAPADLYY